MSETTDLTKILARVAALIAKAESTTFEEEADAFRAKAQELMDKYRLAEEDVLAVDPTSVKPIHEMWTLCQRYSAFRWEYVGLMDLVAHHTGVLTRFVTTSGHETAVRAVGYEVDVRLAMLLWNAVAEAFQARVDVKFDANLPEREMIYRLRSSGIERQKVARMMWGEEIGSKSSSHAKVGKIYKEECAARGEEAVLNGKGIDLATFRKAYADAFHYRFDERLRRARDGAGEAGSMVFAGRKERVQEAYWDIFPEERPAPKTDLDVREGRPLPRKEVAVECEACKRSKSASGKCKDHKPRVITQAQRNAWARQEYSAAAHAGQTAGRQAADAVELNGVKRAPRIAG